MKRFLHAAATLAAAATLVSTRPAAAVRPVATERRVVGEVPPEVASSEDLGPADPGLPLERVVLVLKPANPAALEELLAAQQDPASNDFHRWLTPGEFGTRFGASATDLSAVTSWAQDQGLTIESVSAGRTVVLLSGFVRDFERAFATEMRQVSHAGRPALTNVVAPSVPASLARTVAGVLSLHGFPRRRPQSRRRLTTNTGGGHSLAPADFSTIYNLEPLLTAGLNGSGQKIAVLAQSNISLDDVRFFRQYFGLPANDPTVILNGADPGQVDDEFETDLDAQWSGGIAPGAAISVVVTGFTATGGGVDLSVIYAVDNNAADIISYSYGDCEQIFGPEDIALYTNTWAQAAAQGISVFVATGDSGVAECDDADTSSGSVKGVNGLGSSPYCTALGGTEFVEGANPSAYWSATNDPTTKKSAKGSIPEATWNESGAVSGGSGLWATGGGPSLLFARPAWQTAPGAPASTQRMTPDVSLNAAAHTDYLVFQGHTSGANGLYGASGTSASAPTFAGIAALLNQKAGGRQGNLNPTLYALARAQYGGTGPAVFRDVTSGDNGVPGVAGFAAGPGYDMATGLGSVDAAALVNAWPLASGGASSGGVAADFTLGAYPATLSLAAGGSALVTITATSSAEPVLTLSASGLPSGLTASFSPSKESGAGETGYVSPAIPAAVTLQSAFSLPAPGTYPVTITAVSTARTRKVTILVTVGSPPASASVPSGPEVQAPVILDAFGKGGSHFTSDFVAINRGGADVTLLLRYSAAPGTPGVGGPVIARSLPAGRQLYIADVIAFLAANGYSLPSDGSTKLGTFYAVFSGASDPKLVYAGSRNSTPNPNTAVGGSFGAFAASVASGTAVATETWIYGLTESLAFRSNLALVHSPATSSFAAQAPVGVEVQIYDGDSGAPAGAPLTVTLQPGEFSQLNSVLAQRGVTNGYARVRRTSGTDRFISYGVVNDGGSAGGGTSDGSFIAAGGTEGLVPIVLDVPGSAHFMTELTLTNTLASPATVTLTYTPSAVFSTAGDGTRTTTLAAGAQLKVANAISYLRGLGLAIPDNGTAQGGTLVVQGAIAQGRTYNPNPDASVGGTYGFSYPAVAASARATTAAFVYGLRQDDQFRSNLAIADARAGDPTSVEYDVDLYDADSGSSSPVGTFRTFLTGGQWAQFNAVLGSFPSTPIRNGYARVRAVQPSSFVTYGVANDGPTPGSKTSDGSYLAMVLE